MKVVSREVKARLCPFTLLCPETKWQKMIGTSKDYSQGPVVKRKDVETQDHTTGII